MGQAANVFDSTSLRPPQLAIPAAPRVHPATVATARLIPGSGNLITTTLRKSSQSVMRDGNWGSAPRAAPSIAARVLPELLKQFHPARLGVAVLDVAILSLAFFLEPAVLGSLLRGRWASPNPPTLGFFAAAFLLFATQEGLYGKSRPGFWKQCEIVAKAVLWTTLLTGAALECSSSKPDFFFPVILLSGMSVCALCAARRMLQLAAGASAAGDRRNVLIIGGVAAGQRIVSATQSDLGCRRAVKGFLAEDVFRGMNGVARLRTVAREECIDEVVIATHDSEIAEAAIREARRNQLDVQVVPELFAAELEVPELENLAGVPLVRIHEHPLPEWGLAVKRIADVALSSIALAALAPLLLIIAVAIRLDSPGPVLYRAVRIGRKKQKFICYKFRTMILDADAAKEDLRARNEREGAFFKISNDPRVTRFGRFLRRYSLDELPQLWNVLRGEMSLVGPRPHPPDDVERYGVEHLQRLDFVPGITGLWQVTARRDRSFERSVTLDVEYIQSWSLALDLRILWKTIPAVFQGSGS